MATFNGGCIVQDMGYYPFSSRFFSDLTRSVRSGDFVVALLRESQNLDEYASALRALSRCAADNCGHGSQPISRRPFSIRNCAGNSAAR
jgi:hypothetical protein